MDHVTIDGITLSLASPVELPLKWVGQTELLKQLLAAWLVSRGAAAPRLRRYST